MEQVIVLALAAWAMAWVLSFWSNLDGLREKLGVGFDRDAGGFPVERWASTRLAEWINCPSCAAVIATLIVVAWWWTGLPWRAIEGLAVLGIAVLIVRWWQGARVKAEWWV